MKKSISRGLTIGLALLFIISQNSEGSQRRNRRHRRRDQVEHVTELDQLGRVAILLKTRVDQPGFQAKKNDYACGLSPKAAATLLQAVHADLDAKVEAEAKARNELKHKPGNESLKFSDSAWRNCANACTCFIYQDIFSKAEPKVLTEYDIMSRDYFQKQTANLDEVQSLSCARQVKNFCGSALYNKLSAEAKNMKVDDPAPEAKQAKEAKPAESKSEVKPPDTNLPENSPLKSSED